MLDISLMKNVWLGVDCPFSIMIKLTIFQNFIRATSQIFQRHKWTIASTRHFFSPFAALLEPI